MNEERRARLRDYQNRCNIPPDCRDLLIEEVIPRNTMQEAYKEELDDLRRGKIRTLLVCGTEGTGKTLFACSHLNSYLGRVINESVPEPLYITQSEMNMQFRSAMHDNGTSELQVFRRMTEVPLLVIDEIGRSKNSEYNMENLEAIISKRYAWKRPTILISNETGKDIREIFDRHILDRLATGGTLEMHDASQRSRA